MNNIAKKKQEMLKHKLSGIFNSLVTFCYLPSIAAILCCSVVHRPVLPDAILHRIVEQDGPVPCLQSAGCRILNVAYSGQRGSTQVDVEWVDQVEHLVLTVYQFIWILKN